MAEQSLDRGLLWNSTVKLGKRSETSLLIRSVCTCGSFCRLNSPIAFAFDFLWPSPSWGGIEPAICPFCWSERADCVGAAREFYADERGLTTWNLDARMQRVLSAATRACRPS